MKDRFGPQIIYSCKGCNYLGGGGSWQKYKSYWCHNNNNCEILTTLKTPDNCEFLIKLLTKQSRKEKLQQLST